MDSEKKNSFTTVTPLGKVLAALLFIILPFVGLYLGYTFAPEKVVEVERIVEVNKNTESDQFISEALESTEQVTNVKQQEELTFHTEVLIRDTDSVYFDVALEHLGISLGDNFFKNDVFSYFLRGRKLSKDQTLLTICYLCSHAPSTQLIFEENTQKVKRVIQASEIPFTAAKEWQLIKDATTEQSTNILFVIVNNQVLFYDYANDRTGVLYKELEEGVNLCSSAGMACSADFVVTEHGEVLFGRYQFNEQRLASEKMIEAKIVRLSDNYVN